MFAPRYKITQGNTVLMKYLLNFISYSVQELTYKMDPSLHNSETETCTTVQVTKSLKPDNIHNLYFCLK